MENHWSKEGNWIKFSRNVWKDKVICADAAHFMVWWYLKSAAAFEEYSDVFQGEPLTLSVGQAITSVERLAEIAGIDESKVRRILRRFVAAGYITQKTSNRGRLITILADAEAAQSAKPAAEPSAPPRKTQRRQSNRKPKGSVFDSNASYDLEAAMQNAIGLRD